MADSKEEETPAWVNVQRKTFVKWVNVHLNRKGFTPIDVPNMKDAFVDGETLFNIVNALYDLPIPKHKAHPKMRPQQMDVVSMALKLLDEAGVKTNFLQVHHLLDSNEKMLLGMLWAIILHYAIAGISVDEATAKEGLLLWVQKKTKGYEHVDPPGVHGFSKDWKNGMAFCALVHRHRPALIDYASLDPKNAAENLQTAFKAFEEVGVPVLLDVEDLTEAVRPDERAVMTQVSELFYAFAGDSVLSAAANRLHNLTKFLRSLLEQENDYVTRARALIAWYNFGDTLDDAQTACDNFRAHVVEAKPPKLGERLDIEQLYAEIQTERAVNQRFAFVPPDDASPDAVEAAFNALAEAEQAHARATRDNRFRFVERKETEVPEEKRQEITDAFRHFDKNNSDTLDKIEFKAALMALSVPIKDDEELDKVFARVSEGNESINLDQYLRYNLTLVEDKDSPEQTVSAFQVLCDNKESITREQLMQEPLTEEDVDLLLEQMADYRNEDGSYNYAAFVEAHFKPE